MARKTRDFLKNYLVKMKVTEKQIEKLSSLGKMRLSALNLMERHVDEFWASFNWKKDQSETPAIHFKHYMINKINNDKAKLLGK